MGSDNRQRRKHKQAKRQRAREHRDGPEAASRHGSSSSGEGDLEIDLLISGAAHALHRGGAGADQLIELLARGAVGPGGRQLVTRQLVAERLIAVLEIAVASLRGHGWLPSDVQRVARRRNGASGLAVVTAALWSEWSSCSPSKVDMAWANEAMTLSGADWTLDPGEPGWAEAVRDSVATYALLMHLPALPGLGSLAGAARSPERAQQVDGRILEKVRALLAKAESTTFPEEAELLTAKAQELLARYSIDRAAVAMDHGAKASSAAIRRFWLEDPYLRAKAMLLHVVAEANRCRAVLSDSLGLSTLAGHEDDLDTVEILFTSLLVQATTQMTAAGSRTDPWGRSRTRSYRQSFLVAYAQRIGVRLKEAGQASEAAATVEHGRGLLPVLASRESAADEAIATMFPSLVSKRTAATDREGWIAGTAAADLASLATERELTHSET